MDNNIYLSGLIPPHMVIYLLYHNDVLYRINLAKLKGQFRRMVVPFFDEYGEVIL